MEGIAPINGPKQGITLVIPTKTEISSALTFYNDKQYSSLLDDYEDDLDIMEDRIKELEDKYYKQFTAMETAMSKLQSQQNSLASLLGQTVQ